MSRLTALSLAVALSIGSVLGVAHAASHAASSAITITDDHGTVVHLSRPAKRVISLDPRDTESLFAVGSEKQVVADGSATYEGATGINSDFKYPSQWPSRWGRNYPLLSKRLPHIEGGCCGVHFDTEKIESLKPDLVVAPYSQTELDTFSQLRSLGVKVMVLDPTSVSGIQHDITLVGEVTGHKSNASQVVSTMKSQLAAIAAKLKTVKSRPRVYYEIDASDPQSPYTAGRGTFVDEAIHRAGGANVADTDASCSGSLCYPQLSLETLVRLNPQIVILGDSAYGTTASDVRARGGWGTISAVTSGKIYPFDDELISRAGPRIVVGIGDMAKLIHPGLFGAKK
jgi:iron complex transport system substrate-binding protein